MLQLRHILFFLLFFQFLILLIIYYSPSLWGVTESLFTKFLSLKQLEKDPVENISSVWTRSVAINKSLEVNLLESLSVAESSKVNVTENAPLFVELILDMQQNISFKLSVINESNYNGQGSIINSSYGIKFMPQFNKFIFTQPMYGGLGNQMFRFASLYAMGQTLRRSPVYIIDEMVFREYKHLLEHEIAAVFPAFYGMIYFIPYQNSLTRQFELSRSCCDYQDPQIMANITEPVIELVTGINLENYKYFHNERNKIREIFNFSQEVRQRVQKVTSLLYRNNKSHKLCIHVRTGDFNEYHWESNPVATAEAVQRITQDYMKNETNYSLVFLGEDKGFFKQAPLTEQQMRNVIVTPHLHRGDEIFFGITACDSLLITAHMSSYAFWIGYLMPEESPIYYIANHNNSLHILPPMHDLPPAWVPLDLTIFTP